MPKVCVIFCGGIISDYAFLLPKIRQSNVIICADSGYYHCLKLRVKPDLLVGDFDSYSGSLPDDIEILKTKPEKDETDAMTAVRIALERGCDTLYLCGVFGGRLDHTIANFQLLYQIKRQGAHGVLYDKSCIVFAVCNQTFCVEPLPGYYLSVFAADGTAYGVDLAQVKFPLQNATLTVYNPVGVSNEFIADNPAQITVRQGSLFVMLCENKPAVLPEL